MFEPGKITLLTGPRQVGKTLLAVDAAWRAANARPWLGHELPAPPVIITDEVVETSKKLRAAIVAAPQEMGVDGPDVLVLPFPGWHVRSLGLMKGERALVIVDVGREAAQIDRAAADQAVSRLLQVADIGCHVIMVGVRGETATRGHSLLDTYASVVIRVYSGMVTFTKSSDHLARDSAQLWRFDSFAGPAGEHIRWAA